MYNIQDIVFFVEIFTFLNIRFGGRMPLDKLNADNALLVVSVGDII